MSRSRAARWIFSLLISGALAADGLRAMTRHLRAHCAPDRPVFGDMRSVLRYPFKLVWYERYPAALYDLDADPHEATDLAASRPALVESLAAELPRAGASPRETDTAGGTPKAPEVSPAVIDQLRGLGYLSGPDGG